MIDWGPIPKLEQQLANFDNSDLLSKSGFNWLETSDIYGGLWGLYGKDAWPREISATIPILPSSGKRFWALLGSYIKRSVKRKNHAGWLNKPTTSEEYLETLIECHRWLGEKILHGLVQYFNPFWELTPIEFFPVSQKAIAWTLMAYIFDNYGPDQFIDCLNNPYSKRYLLDSGAKPGDYITLHLIIEDLINQTPLKFNIKPDGNQEQYIREYRKGGGLRKSAFLDIYPALCIGKNKRKNKKWLKAINLMIDNSPLTQIVYLDCIGKAKGFTTYNPIINPGGMANAKEALDKLPDIWGWRELWISHLAKSVIGGVLSKPPVFEELREAEKRYNKLENLARAWLRKRGSKVSLNNYPGLKEAFEKVRNLENKMEVQYVERIGVLTTIVGGSVYFKLRVMDMLLRYVLSSSTEKIRDWWRAVPNKKNLVSPRSDVLFCEESICFQSFYQILFGRRYEDVKIMSFLSSEQQDMLNEFFRLNQDQEREDSDEEELIKQTAIQSIINFFKGTKPITNPVNEKSQTDEDADNKSLEKFLREAFKQLFEPPLLNKNDNDNALSEQIINETRVSQNSASRIISRFYDEVEFSVELPLPFPNDTGYPPATIYRNWHQVLLNNLQEDKQTSQQN